jgi:hypothetical protein
MVLIVLGTVLLAAGNVWILQYAPAETRMYHLHYFIAAPLVLGLLLVLVLPRLGQQKATQEPPAEKDTAPEPPAPPEPSPAAAVQLLTLLQREGRLVDFLQEEIDAYSDAQIGAAVRAIHQGCRRALAEHFTLEPVISGQEGSDVTVPEGFDPTAVRLTGNVLGQPPFKGTLRHPGWRTAKVELPAQSPGQDLAIVTPAEVEIP